MKIKNLLGDRVLVRVDESEKTTKGGLHIPDMADERPQTGTVAACGPNVRATAITEGDRVLFGSYAGSDVVIDGKKHLIMGQGEILAVLGDENDE